MVFLVFGILAYFFKVVKNGQKWSKIVKNRNYKANFFILRQHTENSTANDESADSDPRRLRFESFIVHRWGDIR